MEVEEPAAKEPRGYKGWFFTWNNPPMDGPAFLEMLKALRVRMTKFQLEEAPTTKTPHFQGGAVWANAMRMSTLTKRFPGIYLERLADWEMVYGTKSDTRIGGPWAFGCVIPRPVLSLKYEEMYAWQKVWFDKLSVPCTEDRTVNWLWEPQGCKGKSSLMKALAVKLGAASVLSVSGDMKDIAHAVRQVLQPMKGPQLADLLVVHVDLERGEADTVPYDIFAKLKDGRMFSPKYDSVSLLFAPVHVICTANFPPALERLSEDRWNVIEL